MKEFAEKCWLCGHDLICSGNMMISDWEDTEVKEENDAMITDYVCPYCGAEYSVTEVPESQRKHYPYWTEDKNDGYVGDLFENDEVFKNV